MNDRKMFNKVSLKQSKHRQWFLKLTIFWVNNLSEHRNLAIKRFSFTSSNAKQVDKNLDCCFGRNTENIHKIKTILSKTDKMGRDEHRKIISMIISSVHTFFKTVSAALPFIPYKSIITLYLVINRVFIPLMLFIGNYLTKKRVIKSTNNNGNVCC